MNKPKMIIFDHGYTLDYESFNGLDGTRAVLKYAVQNPMNMTANQLQDFADELNKDTGRFSPQASDELMTEIHNHHFQNYLYEYFNIKTSLSKTEMEEVFWDNAAPPVPSNGIAEFIDALKTLNIRTGVISNMSFSGQTLTRRINKLLPNNNFEFIIASSEYIFRKPHKRIFELALQKANLPPQDVWYCGDNLICDIKGAHDCGITPVWYKGVINTFNKPLLNPHDFNFIQIDEWNELLDIIKELD